jgi:hypothetical protein
VTTTDPLAENCARLSTWVLDDRGALLLALRDARDGLAARAATCTTQFWGREAGT